MCPRCFTEIPADLKWLGICAWCLKETEEELKPLPRPGYFGRTDG